MSDKIDVQNINTPGKTTRVDRAKYNAMKSAMLKVMTKTAPGDTAKDIKEAAKAHLPDDLFPAGATSGWWQKTVQLDLEAKGLIKRADTKPLRFYLT
ncbi:hypothetical protein SAMN05444287_0349 [Octadecabacter temperatus]|uniref:Uncharacterized protein n=1 Tax=Octadecabacter temperatus TaxID=1458307 RepID=A0A0K0Y319_9RHOB|nr:hypothetical protein [Octadecabacter temperatus]AKS45257.1 hypothetical protein OSB_06960 [Octadecabacter temperatus]SIN89279.1 hypothetical protein SAMN05444287_0349 [Octadecabacter temperatus]